MTRSTTFAKHPWLAATVLAASLLAACGGGGDDPQASPTRTGDATALSAGKVDALLAEGHAITWSNEPGGISVAVDAADNVYTVTWVQGPGGDIALTKRNGAGVVQWTSGFDNTDSTRFEAASWVDTDSQGNILVSGTIRSGFSNPVAVNGVLMKFAPDGSLLWRQVIGSPFDGSSTLKLLVDGADNVYVFGLGMRPDPAPGLVSSVRRFAPDGQAGWAWFDTFGIGAPSNIKFGGDGGILVAARASTFGGYAKLQASNGLLLATGTPSSLIGLDIAGDAAGNTYIVHGQSTGSGSTIRKVPPLFGPGAWERTHPMSAFRIELDSAGAPVISGFPNQGTGGAAFAKLGTDGTLLWSNMDADGPTVTLLNHAQMKIDNQDNAYLVGTAAPNMGVVKVAPDGTTAWSALAPFGSGYAMDFGSQGSVFVVGLNTTTARIDPVAPAPRADLSVTLGDSPDPVRVGGEVVFTAVARNQGPSAASATTLNLVLPSGLTLRSVTPTQGSCTGSTTIRCTLGALSSGSQATVTVRARAATRGSKTTTAGVAAAETDPSNANNSATVITTVNRR